MEGWKVQIRTWRDGEAGRVPSVDDDASMRLICDHET